MILKVFTDGGSKGNPGPASIGIVFKIDNKVVFSHNESIGIATNNDAEYMALIKAMKIIKEQISKFSPTGHVSKIEFYSDSRLMVNQVRGLFKAKNNRLKEYILKIRGFEQEIGLPITYHLIPREENSEADHLVNQL